MLLSDDVQVAPAWIDPMASGLAPVCLLPPAAFLLIGPESYLAGAVSLELGGKRHGATTCEIVGSIG